MKKSYAIAEIKNILEKTDVSLVNALHTNATYMKSAKLMFDDLETVFRLYLTTSMVDDSVTLTNEAYHKLLAGQKEQTTQILAPDLEVRDKLKESEAAVKQLTEDNVALEGR